jgi:archaeosortase B (VPXXXP-CTERM-specific)
MPRAFRVICLRGCAFGISGQAPSSGDPRELWYKEHMPETPDEPQQGDPGDPSNPSAEPRSGSRLLAFWRNPAYRFALLFLLYLWVLATAYPLFRERYLFVIDGLASFTAWVEYLTLGLFTDVVEYSDKLVSFQGFSVKIIEECTGIYEVLIFVAAVTAFPTGWKDKAIGIGLGVPLLYGFNVVRILFLVVVGHYWPDAFEFMHLYFWQATLIVMITSVWLLWIFQVVRRTERRLLASR